MARIPAWRPDEATARAQLPAVKAALLEVLHQEYRRVDHRRLFVDDGLAPGQRKLILEIIANSGVVRTGRTVQLQRSVDTALRVFCELAAMGVAPIPVVRCLDMAIAESELVALKHLQRLAPTFGQTSADLHAFRRLAGVLFRGHDLAVIETYADGAADDISALRSAVTGVLRVRGALLRQTMNPLVQRPPVVVATHLIARGLMPAVAYDCTSRLLLAWNKARFVGCTARTVRRRCERARAAGASTTRLRQERR